MKTIGGQWTNAAGGTLRLELSKYALIGGTSDNAPRFYQVSLDSTGSIPANYQIWGNDELMPEGTTYRRLVFDRLGNIIAGPDQIAICGPSPIALTPGVPSLPSISVSVFPTSATLAPGNTQQFTATVTPSTASQAVTWSATNGTITSTGLFTAGSVSTSTLAAVTAASVADPTKSATSFVTITPPASIQIIPGSGTLASGGVQQFTATVNGIANQNVNWAASLGTITTGGFFTAPNVSVDTIVTIRATSVADGTVSAAVQISVSAAITVTVVVSPAGITLNVTQTQQYTAVVNGITDQTVTWGLQTGAVGTISSTGLYTAPTMLAAKSVDTILATSVSAPTAQGQRSVTINPGGIPVVLITPPAITLLQNTTQTFTASVTNLTNQSVTWSLQAPAKGTISSAGVYTAPATVTAQSFDTVVATSVGYPAASATATVTINPAATVTVEISPAGGTTVNAGATQAFTATVTGITNQNVTWSLQSGAPPQAVVGTIDQTGLFTAPATVAVTSYDNVTATSVGNPAANDVEAITINAGGPAQIDLVQWIIMSTRTTQHLVGDPSAPYSVQVLDTDAIYPTNFPKNCVWQIKNKLGHPWDVHSYDNNVITHWITEDGDDVDQAACEAANGTTCWMYSHAYKRYLDPVAVMPRFFTPGGANVTLDNPGPNTVYATTNCESTSPRVITIGDVRGITSGFAKISWGGSIDHGSGTLSNGPNYDSVNGVNTIKVQYCYSGTIASGNFADIEEYYFVLGFGQVAWYHYHSGVYQQKTVNNTLASTGCPVPVFPCGPGNSWFATPG